MRPVRSSTESYVDRSDGDMASEIVRGSRVRHAKFGEGEVLAVGGPADADFPAPVGPGGQIEERGMPAERNRRFGRHGHEE